MWEPKETRTDRIRAARRLAALAQIGFVIYDPEDQKLFHAGLVVDQATLDMFVPDKKTYIGQLEALAGACAYESVDPARIKDRNVLHWVDNTSAIAGMVKGYSKQSDTGRILNAFQVRLSSVFCSPWVAYVPSEQNIADAPSRGDFSVLEELGSEKIDLKLPAFDTWHAPLALLRPVRKRSKRKRKSS